MVTPGFGRFLVLSKGLNTKPRNLIDASAHLKWPELAESSIVVGDLTYKKGIFKRRNSWPWGVTNKFSRGALGTQVGPKQMYRDHSQLVSTV